jgi:Tol biopolymer transport system component
VKGLTCIFALAAGVIIGLSAGKALAQSSTRVSVGSALEEADAPSPAFGIAISADGRFVAFDTAAGDLAPGDTNGTVDVFIRDRLRLTTTRVSVSSAGEQGFDVSAEPALSADGRFVVFTSDADNLVPGDTNGLRDVFIHDLLTRTTERLSESSLGAEGNGTSGISAPSISATGRLVVFDSAASNLVPNDQNGEPDVFLHDRLSGLTTRVSVPPGGAEANGASSMPVISAEGRFAAFASTATNLVPGDAGLAPGVFVADLDTGAIERASVSSTGEPARLLSGLPSISGNGRVVSFLSLADNLVPGDTNATFDVFVRDRVAGLTTRASVSSTGTQSNGVSSSAAISASGRFVVFESRASNLVPDDTNQARDVFVRDLAAGETLRVNLSAADDQTDSTSRRVAISGDGAVVAFGSAATNLVSGDRNDLFDVFVRDRRPCRAGNVNAAVGPVGDVLRINGQTGVVTVSPNAPLSLTLDAAPNGPPQANFVTWIWRGGAQNQVDVVAFGEPLGCTVNPTPFERPAGPQPILALRSPGMPEAFTAGVPEFDGPATAPWTVSQPQGLPRPAVLAVQGILQDNGTRNGATELSITNAVILRVR